MRHLTRRGAWALATGVILSGPGALAATAPPLAGCYERVYDGAHLSKHKRQLAVRLTLSVGPTTAEILGDKANPVVADGNLRIWVRGKKNSFDSHGVCRAEGESLLCGGSLSAAEAEDCQSKHDGVRQCRMGGNDPGSFRIARKGDGVLVTIAERLELVQAPYDGGPFLYFSPANAENHSFLLAASATACQ